MFGTSNLSSTLPHPSLTPRLATAPIPAQAKAMFNHSIADHHSLRNFTPYGILTSKILHPSAQPSQSSNEKRCPSSITRFTYALSRPPHLEHLFGLLGLKIQLGVPFIPQIEDVGSEVVYCGEGEGGGWKRRCISNFSEIMVMSCMDLKVTTTLASG
jgi:hypothetical protein